MNKEINLLDLFSGIGGFAKGFCDAGFSIKKHFFSEIDKSAIANYKFNFKESEYAGPIETIRGELLPQVDIITFGSPCQDFSIAGKGEGLDGKRSGLILEAIRLIDEKRPSFFIWENVKGAFSSNDSQDFWAILQAFANLGNYNIEWQCVNTLWLLPQNRERIYLVGHLATPGRNFKPVFPIAKNDKLPRKQATSKTGQSQTQYSTTLRGDVYRADNTFLKLPNHVGTLTGGGNPKKGGTGLLEKFDEAYCLDTSNSTAIKLGNERYRRLTEIECERLQGFPDNWSKYGIYQKKMWIHKKLNIFEMKDVIKEIPQTNRYKLIGNAVTKLYPQIIAERLIENYESA